MSAHASWPSWANRSVFLRRDAVAGGTPPVQPPRTAALHRLDRGHCEPSGRGDDGAIAWTAVIANPSGRGDGGAIAWTAVIANPSARGDGGAIAWTAVIAMERPRSAGWTGGVSPATASRRKDGDELPQSLPRLDKGSDNREPTTDNRQPPHSSSFTIRGIINLAASTATALPGPMSK
jgi:hypothetical protein